MNRRNVGYIGRYNDRENYPLVDNKRLTKRGAAQGGSPTRRTCCSPSKPSSTLRRAQAELKKLPHFVIKPAQGSGGKGILVITDRKDDDFVKSSGDVIGWNQVQRHLSNILSGLYSLGGRNDVAIVETLINVSPIFKPYSYEGVPDIRLIVFKGYPIMGMMRLATHESDGKANLHQGAIGVGLDIGTGRAVSAVQFNRPVEKHPDSGADLMTLAVPNWRTLLLLAARCYEVTQLGYLGCDIVLDEHRGPMLLELNARPGLSIQIANDAGLLPRLRNIEALDLFLPSVEDRVNYAMTHFTNADVAQASFELELEPA